MNGCLESLANAALVVIVTLFAGFLLVMSAGVVVGEVLESRAEIATAESSVRVAEETTAQTDIIWTARVAIADINADARRDTSGAYLAHRAYSDVRGAVILLVLTFVVVVVVWPFVGRLLRMDAVRRKRCRQSTRGMGN